MNIKNYTELGLTKTGYESLKDAISSYNTTILGNKWIIFLCALLVSLGFYAFVSLFAYNPEDLTMKRFIYFIYGESKILKYPSMGFWDTILMYFSWAIFQIPHLTTTIFLLYSIFISFYFPFKKSYSVRDFLKMKDVNEALLKDIKVTWEDLDKVTLLLKEKEGGLVLLENNQKKIKLRIAKKDYLHTEELNSLNDELSKNKELVRHAKAKVASLKIDEKDMRKALENKRKVTERFNLFASLIRDLREENLQPAMV